MGSILTETKISLGLADDYTAYDAELIIFINGVLADLNQLGLGPDQSFSIQDKTATWESFLGNDSRYNGAKNYMFLSMKLLFDPPTSPPHIMSIEKQKEQAAWRLNVHREDIVHPVPEEVVPVIDPLFGE